jgi:hypothetical protein
MRRSRRGFDGKSQIAEPSTAEFKSASTGCVEIKQWAPRPDWMDVLSPAQAQQAAAGFSVLSQLDAGWGKFVP